MSNLKKRIEELEAFFKLDRRIPIERFEAALAEMDEKTLGRPPGVSYDEYLKTTKEGKKHGKTKRQKRQS